MGCHCYALTLTVENPFWICAIVEILERLALYKNNITRKVLQLRISLLFLDSNVI